MSGDNDINGWWEADIPAITTEDVYHGEDSERGRIDFEIAFFTLILTVVLAYPSDTAVYSGIKALLLVFAVLTVFRRMVVVTENREDPEAFMQLSKEMMVEISALGILYAVFTLSKFIGTKQSILGEYGVLLLLSLSTMVGYSLIYYFFAIDDKYIDRTLQSSQWANNSPIQLWRRYNQNRAIKNAQKIEAPEAELPEKIVEIRQMDAQRTIPFPRELAQFLHGALLRISRVLIAPLIGFLLFMHPVASILAFLFMLILGGQIHALYRRYGLEGYSQRPGRFYRRGIQTIGILLAHPILLS